MDYYDIVTDTCLSLTCFSSLLLEAPFGAFVIGLLQSPTLGI